MANFKVEVELDWVNGEEGFNLDQELKNEIISNIQNKITSNIQAKLEKEMYEKLSVKVDEFVNDYISNILPKSIEELVIPIKEGSWSSDVKYIPLSVFVGKQYEKYLTEKRFDYNGSIPSRDSEKKLSVTEYLLQNYFGKEVNSKVEAMIKTARSDAEKTIVKTLENNIKEQLSVDIIKRLNIPNMLKSLEAKAIELGE